jgi:phytoene/squalene synthetase
MAGKSSESSVAKRPDASKRPTSIELYSLAAEAAASQVIAAYSTSFGWATKLLGKEFCQPVENVYALVRVADEIVDGAAAGAGIAQPGQLLDELETETYRAMSSGFSTNIVVHAFARTAREAGIGRDLVEPFFFSMRQDLTVVEHDQASFDRYVYGSAEVVGLMCLQVFMRGRVYTEAESATLVAGARALGAAFQKVNFLRDLAADFKALGRSYFPNVNAANFDEATKVRLVADIEADLAVARSSLALLPTKPRKAVAAALGLFAQLNARISRTSATTLIEARIRVPNLQKLVILAKAIARPMSL